MPGIKEMIKIYMANQRTENAKRARERVRKTVIWSQGVPDKSNDFRSHFSSLSFFV